MTKINNLTIKEIKNINAFKEKCSVFRGDCYKFLSNLPNKEIFDLVVTSPPYNIGKEYEIKESLESYLENQEVIIKKIYEKLKKSGSLCWQVGNYVPFIGGEIIPLDIPLYPIFKDLGLILKNRIIWKFGHGFHAKKRFSGRYEVILWFVKSEKDYKFNLDSIRVEQKYPGKLKKGELSGNPDGKNPEDFWSMDCDNLPNNLINTWDIPNVKSNHKEKTIHPCQFPVALVERLVKGLTNKDDVVFDPFMGVGSSGVAAVYNDRKFIGTEIDPKYMKEAKNRLRKALRKEDFFRKDTPVFDHKKSNLSIRPKTFKPKESY